MGAAESKLHFRKQIYALSEPLKDITDEFWTSFFVLTESPEDVFNLCSQKDIRTIISQQPGNLKLLLQKVSIFNPDCGQDRSICQFAYKAHSSRLQTIVELYSDLDPGSSCSI